MDNPSKQPKGAKPQDDERLPYEPPTVVSEEVFETLALSCASGPICSIQPKS